MNEKFPRLKKVDKIQPPFPLNNFPADFPFKLGRQIIFLIATKSTPTLEGPEWESIFAQAIGADWKPSNVGLDDIILKNCAWGAKTLKDSSPWTKKQVRLISGRNSPTYSYGSTISTDACPQSLGGEIINIWNARVDQIRSKYEHARTIVLIKSPDLLKLTIFEIDLLRFDTGRIEWQWNQRGNLEGKINNIHCFTWQPHGSQFTIIENVPDKKLCIKLAQSGKMNVDTFLESIGFTNTWIEVV